MDWTPVSGVIPIHVSRDRRVTAHPRALYCCRIKGFILGSLRGSERVLLILKGLLMGGGRHWQRDKVTCLTMLPLSVLSLHSSGEFWSAWNKSVAVGYRSAAEPDRFVEKCVWMCENQCKYVCVFWVSSAEVSPWTDMLLLRWDNDQVLRDFTHKPCHSAQHRETRTK